MAKRKVFCPECGHQHTFIVDGVMSTVAGIRTRKLTNDQFEYTGILPGYLSLDTDDKGQMAVDRFYSIADQALVVSLVGLSAGSLIGFLACQAFPIEYSLQIIPACALSGSTIALSLLAAERSTILHKAVPWFIDNAQKIKTASRNDDVTLTVDHRYRDGNTEAGRTVNRFGTLPVDVERFNEWAQGALIGKSLAEKHWTPLSVMFAQKEYRALIDKMTAGGLVVNLGSNKGNTLTGGGRRALTRHLSDYGITPPSPVSEDDFLGERLAQAQANNGGNTPLPHLEVRVCGENG